MKPPPDDPPASAPEWIVTFSDMISLLVTFFVLLMTFSTSSKKDQELKTRARMPATEGVFYRKSSGAIPREAVENRLEAIESLEGELLKHARPDVVLPDDRSTMGQRPTPEDREIDLVPIYDGLRITFPEEASFAPGSSTPTPELSRSLSEIGRVLAHYPLLVVVKGHTDARFQPTPVHAEPESLSLSRAHAAATILLRDGSISPERVQVAGVGSRKPVAKNDSALGRLRNRRVELEIVRVEPSPQGSR